MNDLIDALNTLRPGARWSLSGADASGLVWMDAEQPRPTDAEIAAATEVAAAARHAADCVARVQSHLDAAARAKGYDSILSACSYTGAANPFQAESVAFLSWRSAVWTQCYAVQAEVQAGTRAAPTAEELLATLPVLVLP